MNNVQYKDNQILGVTFKFLNSYPDQRGFFREVLRHTDPIFTGANFAQWSHSKMSQNVVKAWHYHYVQTDWWYIASGSVLTVLYDWREESPTYKTKLEIPMSADANSDCIVCVRIPPGVLHGCRVLSLDADLMYITSEVYDPDDEGRLPFNTKLVPHDWGDDAITSENDTKNITPKTQRVTILPCNFK